MSDPELVPVGPGLADDPEERAGEERRRDRVEIEITPAAFASNAAPRGASVSDLEALLFVAEKPLSRTELRAICQLDSAELDARLGDLEMQLSERGIRLVTSGERVMLSTAPESGQLIARYLGADAVRLSPAALETLAIIAYRQPATRGVIERIRGVDSGHVVRSLLHRRLIVEQGRAESPGRPILYGTSMEFMERFGLTSIDDLPPLEAEIAAQLAQAELEAAEHGSAPDSEPDDGAPGDGEADDGAPGDGDTAGGDESSRPDA